MDLVTLVHDGTFWGGHVWPFVNTVLFLVALGIILMVDRRSRRFHGANRERDLEAAYKTGYVTGVRDGIAQAQGKPIIPGGDEGSDGPAAVSPLPPAAGG